MFLDTFGAILSFFVFVAPGLLWDILTDRRRSAVHSSTFREAGVVALASTLLSTAASVIVYSVAQLVGSPWIDEVETLIGQAFTPADGTQALPFGGPLLLLAIEFGVALGLAVLADLVFGKRFWGPRTAKISGWAEAIRNHGMDYERPRIIATVWLTGSESGFRGEVEKYSFDLPIEKREITLRYPIVRIWMNEKHLEVRRGLDEKRVVIPGPQIESVGFTYTPRKP